MTTQTQPIINPFVNTVAYSSLPTAGTLFGALSYNLNEKMGWLLGAPVASDIYLYSDLAFDNIGGYYDFIEPSSQTLFKIQDTTYSDQTLVKVVSTFMTYGSDVIQVSTFAPKDYATQFGSKDGIFNLSFFPWNVTGLKNSDGNYCVKKYYGSSVYVNCNPLRKEVLYIKMFTLLKIFGITFGTYALLKLTYKLITKKK